MNGQVSIEFFITIGLFLFLSLFILSLYPRYNLNYSPSLCNKIAIYSSLLSENESIRLNLPQKIGRKNYKIYTYSNGVIEIVSSSLHTCKANTSFLNESLFGEEVSIVKDNITYIASIYGNKSYDSNVTLLGSGWKNENVTVKIYKNGEEINSSEVEVINNSFIVNFNLSKGTYEAVATQGNLFYSSFTFSVN